VTEIERALSRLQYDIEADFRRLEDEMRGDLDSTRTELHSFTSGWSSTQELHDVLDERCREIDTTAKEARRLVQHTAAWLARYTRPSGPRTVVDPTDRPDSGLLALALKADEAGYLSEQLLSAPVRTALRAEVARFKDWQQAHSAASAAAVTASETIARTDPADPDHAAAAAEFTRAQGELDQLDRSRDGAEHRARDADAKLRADDAARSEHEDSIADGVQAGIDLRRALEEQITTALEADGLFAPWFTSCFGFAPEGPDWMDQAIEVFAYRITYGITGETPLGAPPESDASKTRSAWHDQLLSDLAAREPT
jgi:hypothetical protein